MTNAREESRRAFLCKLGLAVGTAYMAPVLTRLSQARASGGSGGSGSFSAPRAEPVQAPPPPPPPPPQIVVATPDAAGIARIVAEGYTLIEQAPLPLLAVEVGRFELPANLTLAEAEAQILQAVPGALVDLNHLYEPGEFACDGDACSAFDVVGWSPDIADCPAGTTVGMVDTTVNAEHAALEGVDLERFTVLGAGREPASAVHGTAIAILLAGRRETRTPGLLSGVRLVAAEAFHRTAAGGDSADSFDVARAIGGLVERGVTVVNLSFAGPANRLLERVVAAALARGAILVAAAGNDGPQAEPRYPAAYEGVVAVTAVDADNRIYRRAVTGDYIDFAAPGVQLWTAASISGGRFRSGTSYAAPFVSAAIAVARAQAPEKPAAQLVEELRSRAVDLGESGRDPVFGYGLVQAGKQCA